MPDVETYDVLVKYFDKKPEIFQVKAITAGVAERIVWSRQKLNYTDVMSIKATKSK